MALSLAGCRLGFVVYVAVDDGNAAVTAERMQ